MKRASGRLVPVRSTVAALALALSACQMAPDVDAPSGAAAAPPAVIGAAKAKDSAQRAAAVAEMRSRGAAAETQPYPDAFAATRNARLAARPEPRSVADTATIKTELADIARRQQGAISPAEIEALKAREAVLRGLLAQAQAEALRP